MMRKNKIAWTYLLLVTLFAAGGVTAAPVDCTDTATTGVPELECNALVALYDATNGADWLDSSNWKTDTVISEWYGVWVTSGHVTYLALQENNLSGTIPSELGNLANLKRLHLFRNTLSGSIPPELGSLSALEQLLLGYNELDGTVPSELGGLGNLIELVLKTNQLTGTIPPALGTLTNLQILEFVDNQLTGPIPIELGLLTKLETLSLENNQLTGVLPPELGALTALTRLYAYDNHLEGPIPDTFNKLTSMQFFRVQRNHLDADDNGDAIISHALQAWFDSIDEKDISAQTPVPPPGITINPVVGLVTTEAGGTANFTVMLDTRPTANVTVNLASSDLTEGSVSPEVLVFTPDNWFIQQTVVIQGLDDPEVDGNQAYMVVSTVSSDGDSSYDGIAADDVSVLNADNDQFGITVSPISGLVTTEAGGTATFSVLLNTQPEADVRIDLSSTDTGEGRVDPASLVFTSSDWDTAQTLTITGVDDPDIDGDQAYQVITSPAVSTDPNYQDIDPDDVDVINIDSDSNQDDAGVTVSPAGGLITTEAGGTASFTVVLNTEPGANVTLELSSSDTGEGVASPASLAFTPGNWDTAQIVTVTGMDDQYVDGDQPYTIDTESFSNTDNTYDNIEVLPVEVTNRDNDTAGVSFSPPNGLTTTETGDTDTVDVTLDSQPTADVNLSLSSSDTSEGTIDPASLTFTPDNWNAAQTVTLTGVEDLLVDGDQPYTIVTDPVSSTDSDYNGLDPDDVSATNQDNDPEPSCSSPPPDVKLQSSFPPGLYLCIGDSSIKTDPAYNVTIENSAEVYLEAPVVGFNTGFTAEDGSILGISITTPAP